MHYGILSYPFAMCAGVRQGGLLSPALFAMYIDKLIQLLKSSGFGWRYMLVLHGVVPSTFGQGIVIPLVKNTDGNIADSSNYRGIYRMLVLCWWHYFNFTLSDCDTARNVLQPWQTAARHQPDRRRSWHATQQSTSHRYGTTTTTSGHVARLGHTLDFSSSPHRRDPTLNPAVNTQPTNAKYTYVCSQTYHTLQTTTHTNKLLAELQSKQRHISHRWLKTS